MRDNDYLSFFEAESWKYLEWLQRSAAEHGRVKVWRLVSENYARADANNLSPFHTTAVFDDVSSEAIGSYIFTLASKLDTKYLANCLRLFEHFSWVVEDPLHGSFERNQETSFRELRGLAICNGIWSLHPYFQPQTFVLI
jgi:hypothetical protein